MRSLATHSDTERPNASRTSCSVMSGRTSNTTAALHSRQSGSRSYFVVSV